LAADIFKVALVALDRALEAREGASRLILQVHDEVLVEVADGEMDEVAPIVVASMADAYDLVVPLAVHVAHGPSWAAAKD
jgi:DNA polymerase-1